MACSRRGTNVRAVPCHQRAAITNVRPVHRKRSRPPCKGVRGGATAMRPQFASELLLDHATVPDAEPSALGGPAAPLAETLRDHKWKLMGPRNEHGNASNVETLLRQ